LSNVLLIAIKDIYLIMPKHSII